MSKNSLACNAVLAAALMTAVVVSVPAPAAEVTVWRPVTAAAGAPVDPGYWNQEAAIPVVGFNGINPVDVTIAPSTTTVTSTTNNTNYDYSTRPTTNNDNSTTTVNGGQTNVNTSAQLGNDSTVTVTTDHH